MMRATLPSTAAAFSPKAIAATAAAGYRLDSRQRPQIRLVVGEATAAPRDLLGAGVEIARPRVIAEPGEVLDHLAERGGGDASTVGQRWRKRA